MSKPRVMLLGCGESVYPQEWLKERFDEITMGLNETVIELAGAYLILDDKDVAPARAVLKNLEFDVIIYPKSWEICTQIKS